ncbi:MAG: hypothetical protein JXK16_08975 [Thiotrichales bacterium]|nr:hypothetical protein [Thiotrichales bacterium]
MNRSNQIPPTPSKPNHLEHLEHSVWMVGSKTTCDYPGYLFWKLQSQLTKLNNRLNHAQRSAQQKES